MDDSLVASNRAKDPRTVARKYQLDLCKRAVEENIIVYLETGCGKTHIAVLLMYELGSLFRKPSESICIFLAPSIPLVRQQAMVIENSTDFKVRCHHGSQKSLKDHDDWNKEISQYEVLVMTPQILLCNLHHCFIKMDRVALLIFDECHHAQTQTRHPYAQIMKEFYKTGCANSPRIFGMTASPIIGKGGTNQLNYTKCINSLENLLDAKVCSVDDKSELESYVASPNVKVYFYGPVLYTDSSLTVAYSKKLEEIKIECISMIKDKICDFKMTQKMMKRLNKLHDNILFCLEHIGLVGAIKAARVHLDSAKADLIEMETVKGDISHGYQQYLTKAMSVLHSNLLDDNNEADLLPFGAKEVPFYSEKLSLLIRLLSSYGTREAAMKCIVFVKRIIVAEALANVLGSLQSLDFWKCEFLVGCHSGMKGISRGKMHGIIEKFSSGEVNLLVATNVAEEGLDIQTCCLVVRFDLPETVASFIQSRGRARMITSEYIFLVERGNEREENLINDFIAGEHIMNKEIISRTTNDTFDELEEIVYKVDNTGASISTGCSVSLLFRYCDKLPRDKYFTPAPRFFYIDDLDGTICRIILPPNSAIRQVDSMPCNSKDEAKRNACLKVCKELHECGALTDYLLPGLNGGKKMGSTTHQSENNSNSTEDESSREELYEMLEPSILKSSWDSNDENINMHFYYIRFVPEPQDRKYQMFGLFVGNPLPSEAENLEVELHLNHGRIVKTGIVSQGMITFNKEEIVVAQNFQEMFLKITFDRSEFQSDFVPLGMCNATQDSSPSMFLLLPVIEQLYEEKMIDWATIRRCLSSQVFTNMTFASEKIPCCTNDTLKLLDGTVKKVDVLNSLIFTPHNNLFFFIDGILDDINVNSNYKNTCYAEYYKNKGIEFSYPEQPFLKAKQLFNCRNLLINRIQENTEARETVEAFVELPPELCSLKILGFSKDIGSSLSLLPSFMHRLKNLLVAIELKDMLYSFFPEASEVRASSILEALTTEKCMERLSLERLEVLGDSFLKYAVGRHSFLTHAALDEGQLTNKRSNIVNNSNLYELATARNLQAYIRDELFDQAQFFAFGRPCKNVCNLDTEPVIHQRGNKNSNTAGEGSNVKCTKSHQWLYRKTIADVVEALVGAFLVDSGFNAAIAFLHWIGIPVRFDVSSIYSVCDSSRSNLSLASNIDIGALEEILGYQFRCKGLLLEAIVHPSYNQHLGGCYQKLEFLGDALLDYLITSYLYTLYPELKPGQITDLRSSAVNNNSFANIAVVKSLYKYLLQDSRGLIEDITKFKKFVHLSPLEKELHEEPACPKVLGDILESCFGAVLLDSGFNLITVWRMMLNLLEPALDFSSLNTNPLRELRELCQYFNIVLGLPDPEKVEGGYLVKVVINLKDEDLVFESTNRNSKAARRVAAQQATSVLKDRGYMPKYKPLEEILLSTKKGKPELIGFDEEPINMDTADSLSFQKLNLEETPEKSGSTNANGNSSSSRINSTTRADESCNGKNGQTQQFMDQNASENGTIAGDNNHSEMTVDTFYGFRFGGTLAQKTEKSQLMEICVANSWKPPLFECCMDEGPSHLKMFTYKVTVEVEGVASAHVECYSDPRPQKKAAQNHAAAGAIWYLKHLGFGIK